MTKLYVQQGTSGLYACVGECRNGRFIKASRPTPLVTRAQALAVQALPPNEAPQPDGERYVPMTFAAPDTLGRVVALRKAPHAVAETTHVSVKAIRVPRPASRQTFAAPRDMLGEVVAIQAQRGQRPAPEPSTLYAMTAQPCERCGKTTCHCPPSPPRTLEIACARQAAALKIHEEAMERAGYPRLTTS